METLIKSPVLNEQAIDLYPQARRDARLPAAPAPQPASPTARHSPAGSSRPGPAEEERASRPQAAEAAGNIPTHAAPARERVPAASNPEESLQAQQASLKQAKAKAVAEGFAKGLADGRRAGEEQYAAAIDTLAAVIEAGKQTLPGLLRESQEVIAAIVFEAVCKIMGREMATSEGCAAVVRQVLAKAGHDEIVAVRISPKDHQRLCAAAGDADSPSAVLLSSLRLEPDDRIEAGGCILTLQGGSIDGRIETQFRTFAQSLKDAVKDS